MAEEKPNCESGNSYFAKVDHKCTYYPCVKKVFRDRAAVYGDQKESFAKIKKGVDRRCEILLEKEKLLAVLVYKINPLTRFEDYDIYNSLEVKTFMLIENQDPLTKGCLKTMLRHAMKLAENARAASIHMTVSAKEPWTLKFLTENGFRVCATWEGKYLEGVKEYLLSISLNGKDWERHNKSVQRRREDHRHEAVESSSRWKSHRYEDDSRRFESERDRSHESLKRKREDFYDESANSSRLQTGDFHDGEWGFSRKRQRRDDGYHDDNYVRPKVKPATLMKKYIHLIREGKKTVEGRLAGGMFRNWRDGDLVRFFYFNNEDDDVHCEIEKVVHYPTFREMLENEGVSACIPGIKSVNQGVQEYLKIPRYMEKEKVDGVVAFRLKVVPKPENPRN